MEETDAGFVAEEAFRATVIEIRQEQRYDLIIVRRFLDQPLTEGWYPSEDLDKFRVGDNLIVTPLTKIEGKGSSTIFRLEKS